MIESFRPGVVDRLGIGYDDGARRSTPAIVYCSTTGYGQDGPRAQWAGHDLNYLAVGGYLDCSGRDADGGPALPGRDDRRRRRRRHAGGDRDPRRARAPRPRPARARYLDVSVADGVLSLMSLYVDEYLATGDGARARPRPPHRPVRLLRRLPVRRTASGSRSARSSRSSSPTSAARSAASSGSATRRRRGAGRDPRRLPGRVRAPRTRDEWVAELGPADTCVVRGARPSPELVDDPHFAARGAFVDAHARDRARRRSARSAPVLAGTVRGRRRRSTVRRDATVTDTDDAARATRAIGRADEIARTASREGAIA